MEPDALNIYSSLFTHIGLIVQLKERWFMRMLDSLVVGTAWSVDTMLDNAGDMLQGWGSALSIIAGAALIIVAIWFVVKIFTSQQGKGMNAVWALLAAGAGAFLVVNGFDNVSGLGDGIQSTIEDMGGEGQ